MKGDKERNGNGDGELTDEKCLVELSRDPVQKANYWKDEIVSSVKKDGLSDLLCTRIAKMATFNCVSADVDLTDFDTNTSQTIRQIIAANIPQAHQNSFQVGFPSLPAAAAGITDGTLLQSNGVPDGTLVTDLVYDQHSHGGTSSLSTSTPQGSPMFGVPYQSPPPHFNPNAFSSLQLQNQVAHLADGNATATTNTSLPPHGNNGNNKGNNNKVKRQQAWLELVKDPKAFINNELPVSRDNAIMLLVERVRMTEEDNARLRGELANLQVTVEQLKTTPKQHGRKRQCPSSSAGNNHKINHQTLF